MEHPNGIKFYKSPIDKNGEYRTYSVYAKENIFIFECWSCTQKTDGGGVGTRKAYNECNTKEEAIEKYDEYIEAWEPDVKNDPVRGVLE